MRSWGSDDGKGILELTPESLWWLGRKAKVYLVLEAKENVFRQKALPMVPNSANR